MFRSLDQPGTGHWVAERIKTEIRLETVFIRELAARVECWNLPQFQFSLPPAPKTEFKQKLTSVHLSTSEERYWTADCCGRGNGLESV